MANNGRAATSWRLNWQAAAVALTIAGMLSGAAWEVTGWISHVETQIALTSVAVTSDRDAVKGALGGLRDDLMQQIAQVQKQIAASDTIRGEQQARVENRLDSLNNAVMQYLMHQRADWLPPSADSSPRIAIRGD